MKGPKEQIQIENERIMETQTEKEQTAAAESEEGQAEKTAEKGNRCCCRKKSVPRSDETVRSLKNRLNRMSGQLAGISRMLDDDRYCGDILIQVAAVESALQSFGYLILKEHMETCVAEDVRKGSLTVMDETIDLIKKLK